MKLTGYLTLTNWVKESVENPAHHYTDAKS